MGGTTILGNPHIVAGRVLRHTLIFRKMVKGGWQDGIARYCLQWFVYWKEVLWSYFLVTYAVEQRKKLWLFRVYRGLQYYPAISISRNVSGTLGLLTVAHVEILLLSIWPHGFSNRLASRVFWGPSGYLLSPWLGEGIRIVAIYRYSNQKVGTGFKYIYIYTRWWFWF